MMLLLYGGPAFEQVPFCTYYKLWKSSKYISMCTPDMTVPSTFDAAECFCWMLTVINFDCLTHQKRVQTFMLQCVNDGCIVTLLQCFTSMMPDLQCLYVWVVCKEGLTLVVPVFYGFHGAFCMRISTWATHNWEPHACLFRESRLTDACLLKKA